MAQYYSIVSKDDTVGLARSLGEEIRIDGSPQVQSAVKQFAKYGLISFSKGQYFKSSKYSFHFFKPVNRLKQLYNLGDEILILCCNDALENFKSRTKDFIDYLLASHAEYKNRLDKITCILIDDSESIVDIIKNDRIENPDSRLIVPFSYKELEDELTEEMLLHRLRDFLYERDLFGIASPLKDETMFFGKDRMNIVSELYGKYRQGEHGGLFGLRRIGKTSILNILCKRIERDLAPVVYFDCSKFHHQRWNSFLHQIIRDIVDKYQFTDDNSDNLQLPSGFIFNDVGARYNEAKAPISFEEDIQSIYKALGNKRILLVFDEIEQISYTTSPSPSWRNENDALFFWQALRATSQTKPELFSYIITGVNPKCIEVSKINGNDNPIFNALSPLYISLFDYSDVKSMVSSIGGHLGLQFDEEIYTKLIEDYGGHPFLVRMVCSKINADVLNRGENRPYTVPRYNYDKHAKEYRTQMSGIIQQILGVLEEYYPEEYELLKTLALDGNNKFVRNLRFGEQSIEHLMGYCLISRSEGDYYIRIRSIEEYIKDKYKYDQTLTDQADKRTRISIRRNDIEKKLRELVEQQLRLKYGKKAKEQLLSRIDGTTQDKGQLRRIQSKTFHEAMDELYLLQLKQIIEKDFKDYEIVFSDKRKFSMYLDIINEMRVDAHAKSISEEDEAMLNYAFKYFESLLSEE